jgi:hypothetical protein
MPARTLRQGQLTLQDATPVTPVTLIIPIMEGDLEWTFRKDHTPVRNRGVVAEFAEGIDQPMAVTFSITFEEYTAQVGQAPSPSDFLFGQGEASANISTELCGPFAVNLLFFMNNPCTTGQDETLTFGDFVTTEHRFQEGEEFNRLFVTGMAKGVLPVAVRS